MTRRLIALVLILQACACSPAPAPAAPADVADTECTGAGEVCGPVGCCEGTWCVEAPVGWLCSASPPRCVDDASGVCKFASSQTPIAAYRVDEAPRPDLDTESYDGGI